MEEADLSDRWDVDLEGEGLWCLGHRGLTALQLNLLMKAAAPDS